VETLRHELAHLALHQAVTVRLPLWFDEGYATWASGQWDVFDRLSINLAVARGEIPTLRELDAALRGSRVTADAAYALAASAALELARRNPTGTLDPLLAQLERGTGFDEALLATTGMDAERFEDAWRRSVRTRFGLFTWLAATGFWFTVSGFVVLGYLLRRRRDRPRRVALDAGWEVPDWEAASEGPSGDVQASTGQDSRPELLSAEEGIAVDRKAPER
jgi:peptidase MA superfamily protein